MTETYVCLSTRNEVVIVRSTDKNVWIKDYSYEEYGVNNTGQVRRVSRRRFERLYKR